MSVKNLKKYAFALTIAAGFMAASFLGVSPRNDDDATYFEGEWKGYNGRNIYR